MSEQTQEQKINNIIDELIKRKSKISGLIVSMKVIGDNGDIYTRYRSSTSTFDSIALAELCKTAFIQDLEDVSDKEVDSILDAG